MRFSRRQALVHLARLTMTWPLVRLMGGCTQAPREPPLEALLVSAADRFGEGHLLSRVNLATEAVSSHSIEARGHGVAVHPRRPHVVLVARRPGRVFYVFDWRSDRLLQTVTTAPARHFFGHAVFDAEGRYLYATENVFDDSPSPDLAPRRSRVGVYDADDGYRRVREFETYGVGAHELRFMPDRRTLVVANGGIYTHPAFPREKLNIDTMDPSLAFIDAASGDLVSEQRLAELQLSVRHLDVGPEGAVAVGLQYEGPPERDVPLMALSRHGVFEPMDAPRDVYRSLEHYIASVAVHGPTGRIAATSPRGNRWVVFDGDGTLLDVFEAADVSGLATFDQYFIATSGTGRIYVVDARTLKPIRELAAEHTQWDNHLGVVALPASMTAADGGSTPR